MPDRRKLVLSTEQDVIADVEHLRGTGYEQVGAWSLPRTCWHLSRVIDMTLTPAKPGSAATPEQMAKKAGFLKVLQEGLPPGMPTSEDIIPPPHVGLDAVDEFLQKTQALTSFPHPVVEVTMFGPVPFSEIRQMHIAHAAHHLSFLVPNP